MLLLIAGLVLWTAAHFFRGLLPDARNQLQKKLGDGSKGLMAVIILASLWMMISGFRSAEFIPLWHPPQWAYYINNLAMVLALYVYFTTATQPGTAFVLGYLRNPQLTGFKIWALAHLLVNGDLASVVLFGGLLAWAVIQIVVSKRSVSLVDRSTAPIKSAWVHLGLVLLILLLILLVHNWLGRWPFAFSAPV